MYWSRARNDSVTSGSAGSDLPEYRDVWEDFALNGRDSDLIVSTPPFQLDINSPDPYDGYMPMSRWGSHPRAITGRHGTCWLQEAGDAWSASSMRQQQQQPSATSPVPGYLQVDTRCTAVVVNALRALQAAQAATDQLNYTQQQQQAMMQWRSTAARRSPLSCALCRSNGETRSMYESHGLKDSLGLVTCPVLFRYVCPFCGATGSSAHTVRYCPLAPSGASVVKSLKTKRDSTGPRRLR